ncbi:MAG: copper amine oxidase N-terminal domain-containing protein [Clostridia bacterium]|nr:copper amine oxidase N-terminal domain-containing protein [Clostridia bacterium]
MKKITSKLLAILFGLVLFVSVGTKVYAEPEPTGLPIDFFANHYITSSNKISDIKFFGRNGEDITNIKWYDVNPDTNEILGETTDAYFTDQKYAVSFDFEIGLYSLNEYDFAVLRDGLWTYDESCSMGVYDIENYQQDDEDYCWYYLDDIQKNIHVTFIIENYIVDAPEFNFYYKNDDGVYEQKSEREIFKIGNEWRRIRFGTSPDDDNADYYLYDTEITDAVDAVITEDENFGFAIYYPMDNEPNFIKVNGKEVTYWESQVNYVNEIKTFDYSDEFKEIALIVEGKLSSNPFIVNDVNLKFEGYKIDGDFTPNAIITIDSDLFDIEGYFEEGFLIGVVPGTYTAEDVDLLRLYENFYFEQDYNDTNIQVTQWWYPYKCFDSDYTVAIMSKDGSQLFVKNFNIDMEEDYFYTYLGIPLDFMMDSKLKNYNNLSNIFLIGDASQQGGRAYVSKVVNGNEWNEYCLTDFETFIKNNFGVSKSIIFSQNNSYGFFAENDNTKENYDINEIELYRIVYDTTEDISEPLYALCLSKWTDKDGYEYMLLEGANQTAIFLLSNREITTQEEVENSMEGYMTYTYIQNGLRNNVYVTIDNKKVLYDSLLIKMLVDENKEWTFEDIITEIQKPESLILTGIDSTGTRVQITDGYELKYQDISLGLDFGCEGLLSLGNNDFKLSDSVVLFKVPVELDNGNIILTYMKMKIKNNTMYLGLINDNENDPALNIYEPIMCFDSIDEFKSLLLVNKIVAIDEYFDEDYLTATHGEKDVTYTIEYQMPGKVGNVEFINTLLAVGGSTGYNKIKLTKNTNLVEYPNYEGEDFTDTVEVDDIQRQSMIDFYKNIPANTYNVIYDPSINGSIVIVRYKVSYKPEPVSTGGSKKYKATDTKDTAEKITGSGKKGSTRTIIPEEGRKVANVIVTDKDGNKINVTMNADGTYSFVQPAENVNVEVTYKNREITLNIGSTEASVDGEKSNLDVCPVIRNDRTMLPIRFVAENLGAKVEWSEKNPNYVVITRGDTKIEITLGSGIMKVNGKDVKLDSVAFAENDRTYLPVRAISEALNAIVEWHENEPSIVRIYEQQ